MRYNPFEGLEKIDYKSVRVDDFIQLVDESTQGNITSHMFRVVNLEVLPYEVTLYSSSDVFEVIQESEIYLLHRPKPILPTKSGSVIAHVYTTSEHNGYYDFAVLVSRTWWGFRVGRQPCVIHEDRIARWEDAEVQVQD